MDARVHILRATALARDSVASPTLGRLYPGKAPVLILQETGWTPGPFWTRRSEEKSAPLHHAGSSINFTSGSDRSKRRKLEKLHAEQNAEFLMLLK